MSSLVTTSGGDSESGELLFTGFNQDNGCFACGMANGFIIYNVDPFKETFRRIFPNGGIGIVEMLYRCNLIAIVGGGRNPRYPTNKVMIWDDNVSKCIGELKFRTEVQAVRLRRDKVVVVLETKVFVYRFKDLKLLDQITTVSNARGLVSLTADLNSTVLAVPGLTSGSIRVELYDIAKATLIKAHDSDLAQFTLNADGTKLASASDKGTLIRIWNTHTGEALREFRRGMDRAEIYCLTFDPTSSYAACSSDKGTVHLYSLIADTAGGGGGGGMEVGRDSVDNEKNSNISQNAIPEQSATAGGVATVADGKTNDQGPTAGGGGAPAASATAGVAAGEVEYNYNQRQSSSDRSNNNNYTNTGDGARGAVLNGTGTTTPSNSNKQLGGLGVNILKSLLPTSMVPKYIDSVWSFAQVRGIEGRSICAFSKDSSKILVVCMDGTFIVSSVDQTSAGDCKRLSTTQFLAAGPEPQPLAAAGEMERQQQHSTAAAASTKSSSNISSSNSRTNNI